MRRFRLAAALAATLAAGSAAADQVAYTEAFANAETSSFTAQIAGIYAARSEILVKLPNRNQFAVPVDPDTDLSVWRTNDVVEVTVSTGEVVGVNTMPADSPQSVTYELVTDTTMSAMPDDSVVRLVTLVTRMSAMDPDKGLITFVAPTGEERTALMTDMGMAAGYDRGGRGMVQIQYYDDIDVARK